MPISLSQSRDDLRGILQEPRPVLWADAELNTLLDLGQKHVAQVTLGYQRQVTFRDEDATDVLIPGLRDYSFAGTVGSGGLGLTDVLAIQEVYLDGDSLVEVLPKAVPTWDARVLGSGTPVGWYEFADVLTLVPYPSASFLTNYELLLVYAAQPADWTTGNSVLPEGMSDLILWFAAALAWYSVGKYSSAMARYREYLELADAFQPIAVTHAPTARVELAVPSRARQGR